MFYIESGKEEKKTNDSSNCEIKNEANVNDNQHPANNDTHIFIYYTHYIPKTHYKGHCPL